MFEHNNDRVSQQSTFSSVGENLFVTSVTAVNYTAYVRSWFNEREDYDYDTNSCTAVCGHYTQVCLVYYKDKYSHEHFYYIHTCARPLLARLCMLSTGKKKCSIWCRFTNVHDCVDPLAMVHVYGRWPCYLLHKAIPTFLFPCRLFGPHQTL